ncbi:MAG: hypothetical protein ACK4MZ_03805 [Thermomonas haemolytica]
MTSRWTAILVVIACLISAGNAAMYWSISSRFQKLEDMLSEAAGKSAPANSSTSTATDHTGFPSYAVAGGNTQTHADEPNARLLRLKQQKAAFDPGNAATAMDSLMAQEPSLPGLEQAQVQRLQQAIRNMPADVPQPAGLQTTCRGRRCLVSAGFSDDLQASDWANRLLLSGGSNLPKAARIIAVPLEGGNGAVSLQLYLY